MGCAVIYNDKVKLCWQFNCEESLLVKGKVLEQAYPNIANKSKKVF